MSLTANTLAVAVLASLSGAIPAHAQDAPAPIRNTPDVELFAHVGAFRAGSDEGATGRGPTYGGTVVVPLRRGFALDVDAQAGIAERRHQFVEGSFSYRTRRTLVVPSLIYRFGTRRVYGFVGGGMGAQFETSRSRQAGVTPAGQRWMQIEPGVFELKQSEVNRLLSMRTGFTAFVTENVGLRGDVYIAGWHVGARFGVGYRFD
jgi:hypothetical protein